MAYHPGGHAAFDGPVATEGYKRAVYRAAPPKFSIEMLSPIKYSSSHNFGMRISPLLPGDRSSAAFTASSSSAEYDIWRKWEDCLIFQEKIETEYRRMARSKRIRLERGKGVKRNGFYKQDAASSWDSLPPGPDPKSVAPDVHEYVPAFTKKATIFRASQATIDQRARELKAFVEALWKEDVPALIDELRNDHLVRDFFGYWRRDHEIFEKQRKQRAQNSVSRTSVTSSVFSMYFSSSSTLQNLHEDYSQPIASSQSTSTCQSLQPSSYRKGRTSSSEGSPSPPPHGRRRACSTSSSISSPSTLSDSSLDSPVEANTTIPIIADNMTFDHDPQRNVQHAYERLSSAFASLPENREACDKTDTSLHPPTVSEKRRKSSSGDPDRRGRIFLSLPDVPSSIDDNSVRKSWQTIDSTSCILEGLDHLTLPASPTPTERQSRRESTSSMATFTTDATIDGLFEGLEYLVSPTSSGLSERLSHRESVATFMTDATVDGVLPRERQISPRHNLRRKSRVVSGPISISGFDHEFSDPDDSDDILDMFLTTDSFPIPCFDIPHIEFPEVLVDPTDLCPVTPVLEDFLNDEELTPPVRLRAPVSHGKSGTFSSKSMTPIPDQLTIKAKFNDSLVLLRVPDEISYKDLRQRLFNKFVGQEGIALSDSYKVTFLQPVIKDTSTPDSPSRSSSFNTEDHVPYPVTSAGDWENVAACIEGYKLSLLITDD